MDIYIYTYIYIFVFICISMAATAGHRASVGAMRTTVGPPAVPAISNLKKPTKTKLNSIGENMPSGIALHCARPADTYDARQCDATTIHKLVRKRNKPGYATSKQLLCTPRSRLNFPMFCIMFRHSLPIHSKHNFYLHDERLLVNQVGEPMRVVQGALKMSK